MFPTIGDYNWTIEREREKYACELLGFKGVWGIDDIYQISRSQWVGDQRESTKEILGCFPGSNSAVTNWVWGDVLGLWLQMPQVTRHIIMC